jgi:hypothetical protein
LVGAVDTLFENMISVLVFLSVYEDTYSVYEDTYVLLLIDYMDISQFVIYF